MTGRDPATWLATAATTAFGVSLVVATGGIILLIAALVAGAFLLIKNWDKVKAFFLGLWNRITGIFQSKLGLILAAIFPFIGISLLIISNFGKIRDAITGILGGITSTVMNWVDTIKEVLLSAFGVRFFSQLFDNVFGVFDRLREGITGIFRRDAAQTIKIDPDVELADEESFIGNVTKLVAGIVFPPFGILMLVDLLIDPDLEAEVEGWTGLNYAEIGRIILAQIHRRDDYAAAERAIGAREGDGPGTIWGRGGRCLSSVAAGRLCDRLRMLVRAR